MKITIVATEAGASHVCELAKAMSAYGDVTAVWHHKSYYDIDYIFPEAKIGYHNIPREGDVFIYTGPAGWPLLDKSILDGYKDIKIIIADGQWMRRQEYYNEEFQNYDVLTNNCKYQFAWIPVREFYQPFDLAWADTTKHEKLTVGHSFFSERKKREKGSNYIMDVIKKRDVNHEFISGKDWQTTIFLKAKCHIFVDQIDHFDADSFNWFGGIGKSGLEAMLLESLVICWGEFADRELPPPPIAWCNKYTFEDVLDYYITHDKEREEKIREQKNWADIYLNPDYCARRVLQI